MASIVRPQQAHSVAEFSSTGVEDHRCQADLQSFEGCSTKRRLRIRRRARKSRREEEVVRIELASEEHFPSLMNNATATKSNDKSGLKIATKASLRSKMNFEITKSTKGYPCIVANIEGDIYNDNINIDNNVISLPYAYKLDYKDALNTPIGSFGRFKVIGTKRVKSDINNIIYNNNSDITLYKDIIISSMYSTQKKCTKKAKRENKYRVRMVRKMNTRSLYEYNIISNSLFINTMREINNKINNNTLSMNTSIDSSPIDNINNINHVQ